MEYDAKHSKPGDVVQIDPEKSRWGPVFVVVTETRSWGVIGYFDPPPGVQVTTADGVAWIRVKWEECAHVGPAKWVRG